MNKHFRTKRQRHRKDGLRGIILLRTNKGLQNCHVRGPQMQQNHEETGGSEYIVGVTTLICSDQRKRSLGVISTQPTQPFLWLLKAKGLHRALGASKPIF